MGGGAFPVGILSDATTSGWNLGALVTIGSPSAPFALRIDAQWMQLDHQSNLIACLTPVGLPECSEPIEYDFRVIDGTANAVYSIPSESSIKFYVIGGAGVYGERTIADIDGSRSTATKFGLNAGAGVRVHLGTVEGFLEARYHNIVHGSAIGEYAKRGRNRSHFDSFP